MKFIHIKKWVVLSLVLSTLFVSCSKEDPIPDREDFTNNAFISPTVGGPNQPNQVYVNLSNQETKAVKRDSWDLAFYCGDKFRIGINSSIYMAVKKLETNQMDTINSADVNAMYSQVAIGTFNPINVDYVDDFDGSILNTAMDEVNVLDVNNSVYLLNLGYSVGTSVPPIGSVAVNGPHRGWKKIRVLKSFDSYILQYADIDDTTHKQVVISKDAFYNFTFFSFNTESEVSVEPKKNNWDLNFTVFTNEIPGYGTYGYTDFVATNAKMNVQSYKVTETAELTFASFALSMVQEDLFSNSQRKIGSSWRSGGGPTTSPGVYNNVFYVVKDTEGIYYKVKFTALTNSQGERGYPQFQYILLQ
ncbi:MAG: HmuY family protein [Flavobacteriaceae bacterium]|nr:HmuY family protein [Flavobacteriaceae bacterium]